jgi:hypothetical protein
MCCESDLQAVDMLRRIFARTFEPMVEMIADFVFTGEFNDPFGEFFIVKKRGDYVFNDKIPEFLGQPIARSIYKTGRNLVLLQAHDEEQSVTNLSKRAHSFQVSTAYNRICNLKSRYSLGLSFDLLELTAKSRSLQQISG